MTTWKPYIFEGREYFEARKIQSWEDIVNQYPGVQIPRSELNKPYLWENYQVDEWSWPGWDPPNLWWPELPPWLWDPPGGGNPCEADDECKYLGIVGDTEADCEEELWYKNVLVWIGCTLPPGIIVGWSATCGEILSVSAIGARWKAPEWPATCTICAVGPGCESCIDVTVTCPDCCEQFTLSGPDTVAAGNNWVATISPACPGLNCTDHVTVVSNSGCTGLTCSINAAGSQLTIGGTSGKCGQIDVTITKPQPGCDPDPVVASDSFRITGAGTWKYLTDSGNLCYSGCGGGDGTCGGGHCNCGSIVDYPAPCISEPYKYGTGADLYTGNNACRDSWTRQCKGKADPSDCIDCTPPPCGSAKSCTVPPPTCGGGAPCSACGYWVCEWKCTCT